MRTRRQRNCNANGRRELNSSSDSCGESEKQKSNTSKAVNKKVKDSSIQYDADSEPSSANESAGGRSDSSTRRQSRVDVDEFDFALEGTENQTPRNSQSHKKVNIRSLKTACAGLSKLKVSTSNTKTSELPSDAFKVPAVVDAPTPRLSSNLKKTETSFYSPARLRVSFSDETFSETERALRGRMSPRYPSSQTAQLDSLETSTPAHTSSSSACKDQLYKRTPIIRLPRLSDIASPILVSDFENSLKRQTKSRDASGKIVSSPQSSGYGSMMKSSGYGSIIKSPRAASDMEESPIAEPPLKRTKRVVKTPDVPVKPVVELSARQQKKLLIERLKEKEERYLAEMEDLDEFDLCIE